MLVSILGSILGFNIACNIAFNFWFNIGFNIGLQYWAPILGSILGSISVLDVPRSLHLKFHQNRVSNTCYIANIEFVRWGVGGVVCKVIFMSNPTKGYVRLS